MPWIERVQFHDWITSLCFRLAQILLCLEDVLRNEEAALGGECVAEMRDHRRMVMEDYSISPEIVAACKKDIKVQ